MSSWYIDRSRNLSSIFKEGMYSKLVSYLNEYNTDREYETKKLVSYLGIGGKNPNAYLTYLRDVGFLTEDNKPTNFLKTCVLCGLSEEQIIILLLIKRDSDKKTMSKVKPFVVISKFLVLQRNLGNEMKINWDHCDKYLMNINSYDEINEDKYKSLTFTNDFNEDRGVLDIWFNALIDSKLFTGNKKEVTLSNEYENLIDFIATHGDFLPTNTTKEMYLLHCSSAYHGLPQMIYNMPSDSIKMLSKYPWMFDFANKSLENNEGKMLLSKGKNIIFYGIPGCGKSYHIEDVVLKGVDKQNDVFRTTFYLDYSNSDFIGQIYPKVNEGKVTYEEIPGPFTKALKRSLQHPEKMIYLVIEEINRGNAAAIFGDTFQLLDRLSLDKNGRIQGDSEYTITNEFIESYLGSLVQKGQVYIPSNMTILATMNTSDQNVFPLDTAFKRRWDREHVIGKWNKCDHAGKYVPGTSVTWREFVDKINDTILEHNENMIVSEDKQLGPWFIMDDALCKEENANKDINKEVIDKFVYNVIDYLYNDVTKLDHTILFKAHLTSFKKVIDEINSTNIVNVFNFEFIDAPAELETDGTQD